MKKFEYHPLANMFPLMEGDEFNRLLDDIKKNGLLEPIVLFDNKILDGRNRYRACIKLGIDAIFKKVPNKINAFDYVIAENIRRRHLDAGQIGLIGDTITKYRVAEREREIKEAEARKLEQELEKIKGAGEKTKILIPKNEIIIPKPTSYSAEAKKIAKTLDISKENIRMAKKVREVAKTEPIIKEALEKAERGKEPLYKVHQKAKLIEAKTLIGGRIDIDQKQVDKIYNIWLHVARNFRYENLKDYSKPTLDKCKDILIKARKFIDEEVKKFG